MPAPTFQFYKPPPLAVKHYATGLNHSIVERKEKHMLKWGRKYEDERLRPDLNLPLIFDLFEDNAVGIKNAAVNCKCTQWCRYMAMLLRLIGGNMS